MYHFQHWDTVETGFDYFFENATHSTLTLFYFTPNTSKTQLGIDRDITLAAVRPMLDQKPAAALHIKQFD
jgi:hypothetical protein